MTGSELISLARDWQQRLGLGHWRISMHVQVPDDECSYAEVEHSRTHDRAVICFSPWLIGIGDRPDGVLDIPLTDDFIEPTVVHELLHLLTADVKRIVDDLDGFLHRDVHSQVEKALDRAEEHLVDRLAESLVKSWPRPAAVVNYDTPQREMW